MENKSIEQDTEHKILMAAEREFLTKGYAGARTSSIAEAAGVTHAMFHYYFRTKEKIFEKIISEKVELFKEMMFDTVTDEKISFEEKLKKIIARHLDFISANPYLPRFLVGEMWKESSQSDIFIREITKNLPILLDQLQRGIDEGAEKGIYRKLDARMLLMDILSLNIVPFLATPLLEAITGQQIVVDNEFIQQRKEENFETIIRKLRP